MPLEQGLPNNEDLVQLSWIGKLLGVMISGEGERFKVGQQQFVVRNGIPRSEKLLSETQSQTKDAFGFIWSESTRFKSEKSLEFLTEWYKSHYGDIANAHWWSDYGINPLLLDAGCGSGISSLGLFGERLKRVQYLGVDVSNAVEAARNRLKASGVEGAFLQTSLMDLPLSDSSVDVIYSQGVLHHTDSTELAIKSLAAKLKSGGRFLFYVYRRKGPIREFVDDFVRDKLQGISSEEAWRAMLPLTKLGKLLGDLNLEIEIPEPIALLEIPAGKINLQRFFYWHVLKAFHHPDMSLEELNHINLDWYMPVNAHRQTAEQVRTWCTDAGLAIEREHLQESGITVIARKK